MKFYALVLLIFLGGCSSSEEESWKEFRATARQEYNCSDFRLMVYATETSPSTVQNKRVCVISEYALDPIAGKPIGIEDSLDDDVVVPTVLPDTLLLNNQ